MWQTFLLRLIQAVSPAITLGFHQALWQHINTHQRRTHQTGSMSLKPNLPGVLPEVLGAHRFNFHTEVSILRCAELSE